MSITVIAHNIRSTHNVGAIFRTCEGFGVEKLIISGYTSYPTTHNDSRLPHEAAKLSSQIHKTALGAELLVPFEYVTDVTDWLDSYTGTVIALEQTPDSIPIDQYKPSDSIALLLGEEVGGIDRELLKHCDKTVEIAMKGQKKSFNVSVATGIALYALTTN